MLVDENNGEHPDSAWLNEDASLPPGFPRPFCHFDAPIYDTTSSPPNPPATTNAGPPLPSTTSFDLFSSNPTAAEVVGLLYGRRTSTSSASRVPTSNDPFAIDSHTPRVIASLPLPEVSSMPLPRLKYAANQFKSYPSVLLTTGRLPYYNPLLYNPTSSIQTSHLMPLPLQIQDLHCIASLYNSRTPATELTVHAILESKTAQLLALQQTSLLDRLAAIQALILYQTVRLRAAGERGEPILEAWTTELQRRCREILPTSSEPNTLTPPPDLGLEVGNPSDPDTPFNYWLFAESVRRTIVTSLMLRGVYALLKQVWCSLSRAVQSVPWTAQRALWEAESGWRWRKVRRELRAFEVKDAAFEEIWEEGE
jgi:hypothetical protein